MDLGFFGVEKLKLSCRAYLSAGGPPLSGPSSYKSGSLSVYSMRLGGRCHDRTLSC